MDRSNWQIINKKDKNEQIEYSNLEHERKKNDN